MAASQQLPSPTPAANACQVVSLTFLALTLLLDCSLSDPLDNHNKQYSLNVEVEASEQCRALPQ